MCFELKYLRTSLAILYLVLITVLDARGPMIPLSSDVLDEMGVAFVDLEVRQLYGMQFPKIS